MPTSYTSLIGLALPQTGELSGTWGDTVNDYITRYLDAAIAGAQNINGSQTAVTLSTTNGSTLVSAGAGATGSAQYSIINCTGSPASTLVITVPTASKVYLVLNATATAQSVTVKPSAAAGITVAAGRAALIAWNGSDFVRVATNDLGALTGTISLTTQVTGTLPIANGGTGSTSTTYCALGSNVSGTLPIANGGTGSTSTTYCALGSNVSGTLPIANGGTGATTGAAALTALGLVSASTTAQGIVELATSAETQTGTDTTRAVTPSGFAAASIGYGQTWQDVTGSRAFGTTYTNSTGKPIFIVVTGTTPSGANGAFTLTIDGVIIAENGIVGNGGNSGQHRIPTSAIVPPGSTYSAQQSVATSTLDRWVELR